VGEVSSSCGTARGRKRNQAREVFPGLSGQSKAGMRRRLNAGCGCCRGGTAGVVLPTTRPETDIATSSLHGVRPARSTFR